MFGAGIAILQLQLSAFDKSTLDWGLCNLFLCRCSRLLQVVFYCSHTIPGRSNYHSPHLYPRLSRCRLSYSTTFPAGTLSVHGLSIHGKVCMAPTAAGLQHFALTQNTARLALNYKKVKYSTMWIEYPELAPTFKEKSVKSE